MYNFPFDKTITFEHLKLRILDKILFYVFVPEVDIGMCYKYRRVV